MSCPYCSTTISQKRADGRCSACGKILPPEMRGGPDALPTFGVDGSLMKSGDSISWETRIKPGDIVAVLQIHQGSFYLKCLTPAEAADFSGPKYIAPPHWPDVGIFFTVEGWEEYHPPKPWWKFW